MYVDFISAAGGGEIIIPRGEFDFIMNGSMEFGSTRPLYWGGWINGEAEFVSPGFESPLCYKITNHTSSYSMITQEVPLDASKIAAIIVSGNYKTENVVRGANQWEKARISIEFHNAAGRVGGYPPVVFETDGTTDGWQFGQRDYLVPKEATKVVVQAGLLNCSGVMYMDNIKLIAKNASGEDIKPADDPGQSRAGWYPFEPETDTYDKTAVIDFTSLLDAPAGKHGFIRATTSGSLEFENKTPVRFWGTNLVAGNIFRTHEETDRMVKRLAKMGINLVRLHHMDAQWAEPSIFDKTKDNTRNFSEESMDRLDYLIHKLKEAGIYVFLDLLVHRKPKQGDGVKDADRIPQGFKEVVYIDEKLRELTKEFIKNIYTRVNKYTGVKYLDEPAIVFSEIVNESSVFYWDRNNEIPAEYTQRLDKMFNLFLKEKYGTTEKLAEAWAAFGNSNLKKDETIEAGNIRREPFNIDWENWESFGTMQSTGRGADTKRFYYEVERGFFDDMYDFIKGLGVKALVAGSNHWERWDASLFANSAYDFIDRHAYWDHPNGGWAMHDPISYSNNPMLKSKKNIIAELGHARVYGKPYTVSEWNVLMPNDYRAGAPVIVAAYSRLNNWDAIMKFDFAEYDWKAPLSHFADFSKNPEIMSQWPLARLIFMDGYVKASAHRVVEYVSDRDMFETDNLSFKLAGGDYSMPLLLKTYKTFDESKAEKKFSPSLKRGAALSMTGELYWNINKGLFQITAEKVQGAAGFLKEAGSLKMPSFTVTSETEYASCFLYSLDNKPIRESDKLILSLAARSENSGAKYSPSRTSVIYGGSAPIIIEPVIGEFVITPGRFSSVKVYSLDANNYISGEYKNYSVKSGAIAFKSDGNSRSMNYYMEIKR
mgnify:CR=1 FL=1